jgi:predicted enzyme related to lactoylglutathione lyase
VIVRIGSNLMLKSVRALGYLRVMFAVDDIDETLERLRKRGAQLVGEVVQ